ncbi:transcription antitermination protein NusB [Thermosynechococcus sp. NK55a]|jgi:N utilization substance protein B|uniref:transcription antitermination factor NusB n=1 Tax=unclassified Thermosynechococcus TaxID=2622553 RepID=UPI0003D8588C|nr:MULTISPECIES: transcription antitermination factor NusB [unclassified Thermosynechococcus]AHB89330.1 transcription antitermination protein NusB [Thermosynechococcus sp. NK55a]RMH67073.1 MAG: transcription antitermination protein NusB [Cyanobacteria bacterium J003]HIK23401.1 transcription antitermination protein NusB [Thermosynechococcus sp. M3746_W2019_013]
MITARRVARELALLSGAQVLRQPKLLDESDCRSLILMAVRTLASDVRDTLEQAGTELSESQRLLRHSELLLPHLEKAQMVLQDALQRAEKGLNKIGTALDLPEILYFAHQEEVQAYAIAILRCLQRYQTEIEELVNRSMVDWQLERLTQLDRAIIEIAVVEMRYLEVAKQVAINEAIELAKRYSDEGSHRFINGVLRRISEALNTAQAATGN